MIKIQRLYEFRISRKFIQDVSINLPKLSGWDAVSFGPRALPNPGQHTPAVCHNLNGLISKPIPQFTFAAPKLIGLLSRPRS
jgi:hypothetical protein